MTRILFVCHGNICRSPMAEFVFREMAEKRGMGALFHAASAATSGEELGNPVHQGTREKLQAVGISCADKRAVRLRPDDYRAWDLLLGMDSYNLSNMRRIFGGDPERRMYRLLDYSAHPRDIADPWYTGDFDATYADVCEGCGALLEHLLRGGVSRRYISVLSFCGWARRRAYHLLRGGHRRIGYMAAPEQYPAH